MQDRESTHDSTRISSAARISQIYTKLKFNPVASLTLRCLVDLLLRVTAVRIPTFDKLKILEIHEYEF